MKKKITTFLGSVASLFMAFTLTSCGDDIALPDSNDNNGDSTGEEQVTIFSSGNNETTRTTMWDYTFYWELGDCIWINNHGTYQRSISSDISGAARLAKFVLEGTLTDKEYPVFYTGIESVSTSATSVTIRSTQTQVNINGAEHIGRDGDCGVATATRDANGNYGFKLLHKASYLTIRPWVNSPITGIKLIKIEVMSGTNIAGTYDFSSAGLADSPTSDGSNTVTLNCGTSGFDINSTPANHYVVIHPGTHTLTLRYTLVTPAGGTFIVTQGYPSKSYSPNGVTTFTQQIDLLVFNPTWYAWGSNTSYTTSSSWNTVTTAPNVYNSGVWAHAPNVNQLYWYVVGGDPRYEKTTHWTIDGGATIRTGGIWMKKRSAISGFSPYIGKNGADMRSTGLSHEVSTASYQNGGRPANTTNYFFMPALGYYDYYTNPSVPVYPYMNMGTSGWYWTVSPWPDDGANTHAYSLRFTSSTISVYPFGRYDGFPVGAGYFQ